jgi:integrase
MQRKYETIKAKDVARLVKQPGKYVDGQGLHLRVKRPQVASWVFQFTFAGRQREMGLGSWRDVSLADARQLAADARKLLRGKTDPLDVRRTGQIEAALAAIKPMTFKECVDGYIADHQSGWSGTASRTQWIQSLRDHAKKLLPLPADEIDDALVLSVLRPLWKTNIETGSRVRGRIERVLNWAVANHARTEGPNPAKWEYLSATLGSPTRIKKAQRAENGDGKFPSLPYAEMPAMMTALRAFDGNDAAALEMQILTMLRPSECRLARWDEFKDGLWTVPASRMKLREEHEVPLSAAALAILQRMLERKVNDFVFAGSKNGKPTRGAIGPSAYGVLLREKLGIDRGKASPHGFRSSFRVWATETVDKVRYSSDTIERALAHKVGTKTGQSYDRTTELRARRELGELWAAYCGAVPSTAERKVVAFTGR